MRRKHPHNDETMQAMWDHVVGRMLSPESEPDERVGLLLSFFDAILVEAPEHRLSGMLQVCKWAEVMQSDSSLPPLQYACVSYILRDAQEQIARLEGAGPGSSALN
jgi:hypothetical protein